MLGLGKGVRSSSPFRLLGGDSTPVVNTFPSWARSSSEVKDIFVSLVVLVYEVRRCTTYDAICVM